MSFIVRLLTSIGFWAGWLAAGAIVTALAGNYTWVWGWGQWTAVRAAETTIGAAIALAWLIFIVIMGTLLLCCAVLYGVIMPAQSLWHLLFGKAAQREASIVWALPDEDEQILQKLRKRGRLE